jgi:DNA-directed RNA polymerase subunit RPC12/RpoP
VTEKLEALRSARDGSGRRHFTDFIANKGPRCPHCGEEIDIAEHELWQLYDDEDKDIECPLCDHTFHVQIHVSYSYSTDDQSDIEAELEDEEEAASGVPERVTSVDSGGTK